MMIANATPKGPNQNKNMNIINDIAIQYKVKAKTDIAILIINKNNISVTISSSNTITHHYNRTLVYKDLGERQKATTTGGNGGLSVSDLLTLYFSTVLRRVAVLVEKELSDLHGNAQSFLANIVPTSVSFPARRTSHPLTPLAVKVRTPDYTAL